MRGLLAKCAPKVTVCTGGNDRVTCCSTMSAHALGQLPTNSPSSDWNCDETAWVEPLNKSRRLAIQTVVSKMASAANQRSSPVSTPIYLRVNRTFQSDCGHQQVARRYEQHLVDLIDEFGSFSLPKELHISSIVKLGPTSIFANSKLLDRKEQT